MKLCAALIFSITWVGAGFADASLDRVFRRYEVHELDLASLAAAAKQTRRLTLELGGKRWQLLLEPVSVSRASPVGFTYRGTVAGEPGSDARLLIHERLFLGYIRTREDVVLMDPAYLYEPGAPAGTIVAYRDKDVQAEFRGTCGVAPAMPATARAAESPPAAEATVRLRRVELATDADGEFFQANGDRSNLIIEGLVNVVDGLYANELGLKLEIVFQTVFTNAATDPYTTSDAGVLLEQFRAEWNANRGGIRRDVAHLFTGKNLLHSTVGIAYLDTVCNDPGYAYSLSRGTTASAAKILAHEIAHNFGARHDDELIPPAAVCDGSGPLMCASIQPSGPFSFSQRSIDDITAHVVAAGSCLDPLPTVGLTTTVSEFPAQITVGETIPCDIVVSNAGPDAATGLTLAITLSGAAIASADSTLGGCIVSGDTITCGPGIVASGAVATASLMITPNRAGSVCVTAAASAEQFGGETGHEQDRQCATAVMYDLAVVRLKAPRRIVLKSGMTGATGRFTVTIRNRGSQDVVIPDVAALADGVEVKVESLGGCADFWATLAPPKKSFPISLKPGRQLKVRFSGEFSCVNDPLASSKAAAHPDYRSVARVSHLAMTGVADIVPGNDECPRAASDADTGCPEAVTDVVVKP
jgi:hypothetical protein